MLDFFAILSRGGVMLWCIKYTEAFFGPALNSLIESVILEEKMACKLFHYQDVSLQYRLDNQFELLFIVAYQKILQLSYIDKLLDQVRLEFRDRYKNRLESLDLFSNQFDFETVFKSCLKRCEQVSKIHETLPKPMKSYEQSEKSKKTIGSMILYRKNDTASKKKEIKKPDKVEKSDTVAEEKLRNENNNNNVNSTKNTDDLVEINREKYIQKMTKKIEKLKSPKQKKPITSKKPIKQPRVWDLGGNANDLPSLERKIEGDPEPDQSNAINLRINTDIVGRMRGNIQDMDDNDSDAEENRFEELEQNGGENVEQKKPSGIFASLKSLVSSRELTEKDLETALSKFCDHLIAKNVALEVATKLCDSISKQLCGKVLGTFQTVRNTVKTALYDSLLQILSPKRRVDILRDCLAKKAQNKPYVITFCGVNGVGKSTNLAKIAFWLIENDLRVLIAACDTFRAGAVEQLRTHVCHLNALYSKSEENHVVKLFEQGYGKDAAKVAMQAVKHAHDKKYDVVLIDTAGRMHNKEHLMRDLAKLVKFNEPDLVLFVGEALVGNVAVNQLVKFNEALVDYATDNQHPKSIDGILLTKFDTVDDKVGAAISMTYVSGQPIMFVGTGQNYTDLKALNPKVIVNALMK